MYLFDPSLLQIVMAVVAALAAAYLAAWLVTGTRESVPAGEGEEGASEAPPEPEQELETRKKAILWTAAGAVLLFLLWWATLSTGSGGRPML